MTFEEYARLRLPALLRTATAICAGPQLAEEIVQDVLVKLDRHWDRVARSENIDAYVRRMLVNEYISWRRKWIRLVPTDVVPDRAVADHAGAVADQDLLRRALATLPRRQQIALALRYFDDLDDREIAAAMGCAESSVRSFVSRGLAALRIQLVPVPSTAEGAS